VLALAGIALGVAVSLAARVGIQQRWPLVHIDQSGVWMLRAMVIAIVGATLGAMYPPTKRRRKIHRCAGV